MCGIVGYIGAQQAAPILLDGLSKLEYRGYDSAGICVFSDAGFQIAKTKGRLAALCEMTENGTTITGTLGIGHTRWATHGAPSNENSHPHLSTEPRWSCGSRPVRSFCFGKSPYQPEMRKFFQTSEGILISIFRGKNNLSP